MDNYNYDKIITITKTANGDAVITMNSYILTEITAKVATAMLNEMNNEFDVTADKTQELLHALINKAKEAGLR